MEQNKIYYKGFNIRPEYVKCSKENCTVCRHGDGHGPYYYAYKRMEGKLNKIYIGRKIPADSELDEKLGIEEIKPQFLKLNNGTYDIKSIVAEVEKDGIRETIELYKKK